MTLALHGKSRRRRGWLLALAALAAALGLLGGVTSRPPGDANAAGPWYVGPAGNDSNDCLTPGTACATLAQAVTNASSGDTINVAAGTYTISSAINITKQLTITGTGSPVLQVSGAGDRLMFNPGSSGSTFQGFKILKTDKTGEQNILFVNASNITITNNEFAGQYIIGDPDVSRAMVVSGSLSGVAITNNVVHDLRQPAYLNGPTTGTISGNYVYRTKGWVIEGGDYTFSGNTWGTGANQNVYDVAILSSVPPGLYTNIPAMAAANNDAFIEDQRPVTPTLSIVYVDPAGASGNDGTAMSPKQTVQQGIDRVVVGGIVRVRPGTYPEDVTITKAGVRLFGAGIDQSTIVGAKNGPLSTVYVQAAGIVIDGFTITRDGNNTADWNNANGTLNTAGVAVQNQGNSMELRNSKMTGNRTGVDINHSNGNNIHNNIIDDNRTGLIFRNQTDNTILKNNFITNNWTLGIVFIDPSSGSNSPLQQALNSQFNENDLSGNWYGGVAERQVGGSLLAEGANLKNFENNWWGATPPTLTGTQVSEPGYSVQIPVAFGGSAVPPGTSDSISGPGEGNVEYEPYLCSGLDTSPAVGFQPAFGCGDIEVIAPPTATVGDTGITVQVVANNAANLYGVQVQVTYGSELVLTNRTLGPGLPPTFVGLNTHSPGVLTFAFTEQSPGLPVSGSGIVLATLTFSAVSGGTANITITPASALFSNNLGFPIGPDAIVNDSITVSGAATTVAGTILLQGRSNHSGATAEINPLPFPGVGSPLATTSNAGAFTITGVTPATTPVIRARMLGYLLAQKTLPLISVGPNSAGATVTLLGGDADMSGKINVLDLSVVASYFGQTGPGWSPAFLPNTTADINGDNVVNILDLSLTAANFGIIGPTTWAP